MTVPAYIFVLACLLWTLLAACVAAALVELIGIARIARWLRLDIGEDGDQ